MSGCTRGYYRRSADKEVYGIIRQMDARVFGTTNAFTINTRYSGRDPKAIPPEEIIEDRARTNRLVIDLDQALALAIGNSPEYQSQKEQLYLTALSLTGARYEFSPIFFANTTPQMSGTVRSSEVGSMNTKVGVDRLLKTGGRLGLALGNDLVRYFTGKPDLLARNSAVSILSVDLSQPLLRGFGANDPLVENLTQSERNVVYAVRSYSLFQQQFSVEVVTAYFALLTQKDIVRNNYRNYTNRVETTRYLQARAVDRVPQSNVDDARTAELSARTSYINSLAGYLTGLDSFKIRLGLPVTEPLYLEDKDLEQLVSRGTPEVDVDADAAFALCLRKQMDILNAIDRFEDSKRKVRVAADRLRAEANLFASSTLASDSFFEYQHFDPNQVRYTAGVQINLPIDRLRERNNYRATLVSFESQIRSLASTLDNYRDRVDRGLRSIEQARLNYINGVESLKVAERRVENNAMLLEAGRATIRDLREAQDSLIDAQNDIATLSTAYLAARLNLLLNVGAIDIRPDKFWLLDPLADLPPAERRPPPLRMPEDQVLGPERFLEPTS